MVIYDTINILWLDVNFINQKGNVERWHKMKTKAFKHQI